MSKAAVLAGLDAQRVTTLERLRALPEEAWAAPTARGLAVGEAAAWIAAVDTALAAARFDALGRLRPEEAAVGSADEVMARLDRAGARLRRRARALPAPLWRTRVDSGDGLRRPLVGLLRLRVLREWVTVSDPAFGPEELPPAAVGRVLVPAALERLPLEVLPHMALRVGVLRLVVVAVPGAPLERSWGIDFARKHYGPRVNAAPDATVRISASALAHLLEGAVGWSAVSDRDLQVEGDRDLAIACLAAMPERVG